MTTSNKMPETSRPNTAVWRAICSPLLCLAIPIILLSGCATGPKADPAPPRAFNFQQDTFAYPNELVWEYFYDTNGVWKNRRREPKPTYSLHCVVVARSARQFFDFARFDPQQPVADEATYRRLVRRVIRTNPRRRIPLEQRIVIPGYAGLRQFSQAHERLLKEECGGAWQSYVQRGHWRMIFPFSRHKEERVAQQLLEELQRNHPPIAHLVRFPSLMINHAILIFASDESPKEIHFLSYDPNHPAGPVTLTFDRQTRVFTLPYNDYFPGGRVDVYEIYHQWDY